MHMRRGARSRALVVALAALVALGLGRGGAAAEWAAPGEMAAATTPPRQQRLTVVSPSTGYYEMAFVMAQRHGYFAEEGLDVTRVQMAGPVTVAAMIAGDADYSLSVGSTATAIVSADAPLKLVMGTAVRAIHALVTTDPAVQSVADLRGRSVATTTLTDSSAAITRFALRAAGLQAQEDTALQPLGESPNRLAALETGQVQASILDLSHAIEAERRGARILARPADLPDLPTAGLAVTETRLRQQPQQIELPIRAMLKGVRHLRENREDAIVAMMAHLGLGRETTEGTYDLGAAAFTLDGIIPDHSLQLLIESAQLASGQTSNVTPERIVDFSLVRRVYAQLNP
jgi:ABC-type nitrate/sulfonate/bicarbonate transport system substrate-binding protein